MSSTFSLLLGILTFVCCMGKGIHAETPLTVPPPPTHTHTHVKSRPFLTSPVFQVDSSSSGTTVVRDTRSPTSSADFSAGQTTPSQDMSAVSDVSTLADVTSTGSDDVTATFGSKMSSEESSVDPVEVTATYRPILALSRFQNCRCVANVKGELNSTVMVS